MAVPAGIVSKGLSGAGIALLEMAAEGSGSACADVTERPQLSPGETAPAEELLFVLTEDIGDFEPMSAHLGSAASESLSGISVSASSGLGRA